MRRIRLVVLVGAVVSLFSLPGSGAQIEASHRCGLQDISHTVNTICDNYHNPKVLIPYILCIATGDCPIG